MAGDGVAVIKVAKLAEVNASLAPAIHCQAYSVGFDFGDRTECPISDPFLSKRGANLEAVALCEAALGFIVNAHTGQPRWVVSELAATKKANGNSVRLVVSVYYSGVLPYLHFVDLAGAVVADYV